MWTKKSIDLHWQKGSDRIKPHLLSDTQANWKHSSPVEQFKTTNHRTYHQLNDNEPVQVYDTKLNYNFTNMLKNQGNRLNELNQGNSIS